MKTQVYFKYREHPGDMFRNTDKTILPDPVNDQDDFFVQFLPNYQSDQTVAYLNDLYKLLYNEFSDDEDKAEILESVGDKSLEQIKVEIGTVTQELYNKASRNFYDLAFNNRIEIVNEEKE